MMPNVARETPLPLIQLVIHCEACGEQPVMIGHRMYFKPAAYLLCDQCGSASTHLEVRFADASPTVVGATREDEEVEAPFPFWGQP